jgi:hypothetical protein
MFVEDWVGKDWNEKRVRLDMVGLGVTVWFWISCILQHRWIYYIKRKPIIAAVQYKTRNVFARLTIWFLGKNPTRGTAVCLAFFFHSVLSCVDRSLATGWSLDQGLLPNICKIHGFRFILNGKRQEGLIRQKKKMMMKYILSVLSA